MKNTMVLLSKDLWRGARICIRNEYSRHFHNWSLILLQKSAYGERTEYKFGIAGIIIVLIVFKKQTGLTF